MSPGPTEEAGKVASGIIDALKSQPALLVLALTQALFLAAIFWAVRDSRVHQHEIMTSLIAQQAKTMEMLAKCGQRQASSLIEIQPLLGQYCDGT